MIDATNINWLDLIKKGSDLYKNLNIEYYKNKYSGLLDSSSNILSSKIALSTMAATLTGSILSGGFTKASMIGAVSNTVKFGIPLSAGASMLYDATNKFTEIKFSYSDYLFMAEGLAGSVAAYYFSNSPITSIIWHGAIGALYRYGQHYSTDNIELKNKLGPELFATIMQIRAQKEQASLEFVGGWQATKIAAYSALLPMATNIALGYFTHKKLADVTAHGGEQLSTLKTLAAATFGVSSAMVDADNPLSLGLAAATGLVAYLQPIPEAVHE